MKNVKVSLVVSFLVFCLFPQGVEAVSPFTAIDSIMQGLKADSSAVSKKLPTVTVEASNITHYADRDVVHITRSMRKGARNTAQMLGNIPGIDCNYANNALTYYGSSNILILVDSLEKSADYVKELHHLRFSKVDVVPNPTGKYANYDVLINLHTKPDYTGYEGNVFQQMSVRPNEDNGKNKKFSGDYSSASFTYTKNKWNFIGRYNFRFLQSEKNNAESTYTNHVNRLQESTTSPMSFTNFFRIHNTYWAIDHQINKNHSVSASYYYSTDAKDDYTYAEAERLWLDSGKKEAIGKSVVSRVNSDRHTLGLYYRGRSGVWNYTYDFNYINDGWTSDKNYRQNTGYASDNYFRNHMDYVWTKSEVNRRFFNNRFYFSAGYNFTWKDYEQEDRLTGNLLSENSYHRNEIWTWLSYRIKDGTDLNFSASAEHVKTHTASYEDKNMVYKFSGMFYHRWNKKIWMRLNYWCNTSYPQLDQVTEYGYFTDSLTWSGGNPALRTQVYHSGRLWVDFFNLFNIQTGYNYSPNQFSNIIGRGEGTLPSGENGAYITYTPENTMYKEFWATFYFFKKIKDFRISGILKYQNMEAKFKRNKNTNQGFTGFLTSNYYNDKHFLSIQATYQVFNGYQVRAQGKNTQKMDCLAFILGKDFFHQRVNLSVQYVTPRLFLDGNSKSKTESEAVSSYDFYDINETIRHSLMFTFSYRFHGGKSVRQYNRSMQEEK